MSTDLSALYGSAYGSLYCGTVTLAAFYGVACMQTFFYYVHYQNDPLRIQVFVAIMWIFNTVQGGLGIAGAYKFILAGLVNPLSPVRYNTEILIMDLFTVLVSMQTQGYFVYRIYVFSGKNVAAPLIWVPLAVIQLACTAIYAAKSLSGPRGTLQIVGGRIISTMPFESTNAVLLFVAAGVDILIAISMTFLLIRERAATRLHRTARLLERLTVFAVSTGIWPAVFALSTVILMYIFPSNLIYSVALSPLCSVYYNTFLANLNARAYLRKTVPTTYDVDVDLILTNPSSRVLDRNLSGDEERGEAGPPAHPIIRQAMTAEQPTCNHAA